MVEEQHGGQHLRLYIHSAELYGRGLERSRLCPLWGPIQGVTTEDSTKGRCQNLATVMKRPLQVLCGEQPLARVGRNRLSQEEQTQGPNG